MLNFADGDEPLLSGTGEVSKDCSDVELESWREVLSRWTVEEERPRNLAPLVRQGIPEALRGEVWQRLATSDTKIIDNYRILITKVCPYTCCYFVTSFGRRRLPEIKPRI
jgi:hypothetical protein